MSSSAIAGRRRVRPPPLTDTVCEPSPTVLVAKSVPPPSPTVGATRPLPPLDYDESAPRGVVRSASMETTQPGRRRMASRARWFVLGIAVGSVVAALAGGGARSARHWVAGALRSFEHHPSTSAPATTSTDNVFVARVVHRPDDAPCPVDPGPDDPCAELLAPFSTTTSPAPDVPTVSIDDLPRVVVVHPVVIARHRSHGPAAAPHDSDESADGDPAPTGVGVNPDDDSAAPRVHDAPVRPAPPPQHPADPGATEQAKNDAT